MGKVFSYKNSLNLIASRRFKELKKLCHTQHDFGKTVSTLAISC